MSADAERIAELERQVAQLTEQCATARRELEAFSYAVSHDLRAPLRSLSGFSQALSELPNANPDPKAAHYLARIQQAARKLSDLIDALLSLSRIARADMQIRTIDFTQVCSEAAAAVARNYPDRAIELTIQPGMSVQGDSRLMRTAMECLIDNAYKFSAPDARVQVEIGTEPSAANHSTYFVRDHGIGFDMAYAEKLFRPFQRMHAETQFPGVGIGLASVYRVLERHGGRVAIDSRPNEGTTVRLSLPSN